jgi:hypothetical protein
VPATVTRSDRAHTLEAEIEYSLAHGWRLRSKNPAEAHLVKGEPVHHWVHLFFTITTLGLWLLVWVPLILLGGEKHRYITVGQDGRVSWSSTDPHAVAAGEPA